MSSPKAKEDDAQAPSPSSASEPGHKPAGKPDSSTTTNSSHPENGGILRESFGPAVKTTVKSFQTFISFIVGVSIFGASTFAIIAGQIQDPRQLSPTARFDMQTVRIFLALAWLYFIIALGVAGFSSSILTLKQEKHSVLTEDWHRRWKKFSLAASIFLQSLVIGAFWFLSLALIAYVEVVGWIAVVVSGAAGIFALVLWIKQI
jgi:MFS family permease